MMQLIAVENFPEVLPGDDVAALIKELLANQEVKLQAGDVLVLAQKIISKAENQYRNLDSVKVAEPAKFLADKSKKDPRLVQLILDESEKIMRVREGLIIVEHRLGFIHANAGIDQSNLAKGKSENWALLLPKDPQQSAEKLHQQFSTDELSIPVIINDSMGRAWRQGTVGLAIACAGMNPVLCKNGNTDRAGKVLKATFVSAADEIAAAASLMMGQAAESLPVVIVRGCQNVIEPPENDAGIKNILRDKQFDLFR